MGLHDYPVTSSSSIRYCIVGVGIYTFTSSSYWRSLKVNAITYYLRFFYTVSGLSSFYWDGDLKHVNNSRATGGYLKPRCSAPKNE